MALRQINASFSCNKVSILSFFIRLRSTVKHFYYLFAQTAKQLLCCLYMQQLIQVLVIFLVISFCLKLLDKKLWPHLWSHSVCFLFLWHGNTNEKRQLMAWGGRHVVSTGRLQWQVWTLIKEVGWEHIDFPKKNTFLSFQRYLPVIICCCFHLIRVNWNKFLFAQVAAQAILSHCNSTKLYKTENMQHSFCHS